ncbi:hypothetical protein N8I77_004177 [Diaporthe amygdali]|uniref:PNPLA domain-containing protein n=1 Tax=Phomopsis amygdali TaxID=1214568 RepID=A0AAD9SLE8_PHOAM|nr:hypothetical protein N8I77_004177 [Diaporthe amygdali]
MSVSGENEPVNLLALDGGGIRGVSELVILDEVMRRMQHKGNLASLPKPCDYFHLFGGTSTGGLVAIMLGRLGMGTQEALKAYDSFASEIFSKRRLSLTEKFKAKALEDTVKKLVREQGKGSVLRNQRQTQEKGHAFVCTMPAQRHKETVRLRTYDVAGDKYPNCLIYEAARATTAATTYFRPMAIKDEEGKEEKFVDAALGTNNPISILWDEAVNLFGKKRRLGCVVSLGTGSRKVEMAPGGDRLVDKIKFLVSAIKVVKEIGTDSEKDHERWQAKFEEFDYTYFRLNVDGGAQGIALSDWKKINQLKSRTRDYLRESGVKKMIDDLAEVLLGNKSSGLNLAHGGSLSKETTIPAEPRAIRRGKSSNIFTGRDGILNRLDKHFGPREPGDTSRREFHLRGMGGVGKTQIALKFTERNERRFHILWVDATDAVTTEQSYKQIALSLFGPDECKDPVQRVVLWLQKSDEEWLLVFDNAPVSGLGMYLPDGDHGNVLYTSRHRNLQPRLRPECVASIEEMEAPEAMLLLLRSAQMPADITENRELARSIVHALGLLPLAIDQAGAYIHMAPCPLKNYLGVFNEQKEVLLRTPRFKGGDEKRHIAVYATFNISYKAIKAFADKKEDMARVKDAETALKLLNLICFYHNEGFISAIFDQAAKFRHRMERSLHCPLRAGEVDLESLVQTIEIEVTPKDPQGRGWVWDDFVSGIGFLHEFSLLKLDTSTAYINMHVLVHDWARDRLDTKEKLDWGLAAKSLLMDSINLDDSNGSVAHRRNVLPDLEVCMKHVHAKHNDPDLESEHQSKLAKLFRQAGDLKAAETELTKALVYRKAHYGLLDLGTFSAMSQLARVYLEQGHYSKAEEMLLEVIDRRALYLREQKWLASLIQCTTIADDEAHKKTMLDEDDLLNDGKLRRDKIALGSALSFMDNMQAAASVCEELMRWHERKHGRQSQQARKWRHMAKKAHANVNEEVDHSDAMTVQEARELLEDREVRLGFDHYATIAAKEFLAAALTRENELREAQTLMFEVLEWNKNIYGEASLQHTHAVYRLAVWSAHQNRLYDAENFFIIAICRYTEKLGKHHPETLDSMRHLAMCLAGRAEYARAAEMFEDCLEGSRVALGNDHRLTIFCAHALRQFRYYEETVPDHLRAGIKNSAVQANRDAWGEFAPQWMQEWMPVSVEDMMTAALERGETLRSYKMVQIEIEGFPFFELTPLSEYTGMKAMEMTVQRED